MVVLSTQHEAVLNEIPFKRGLTITPITTENQDYEQTPIEFKHSEAKIPDKS